MEENFEEGEPEESSVVRDFRTAALDCKIIMIL